MNRLILGLAAFATVATAMPAFTASASAQPVDRREATQQHRILQGARSGALTPHETQRLEHREGNVQRRESIMRARDGGRLTHRDRRVLARRENRISHAIYRKKHNVRVD
jgi:Ni/Co efflux regulator RcnB